MSVPQLLGVHPRVVAQAGRHPLGVAPALVELPHQQQPRVARYLPLVPLDNHRHLWDKLERQLTRHTFNTLRHHRHPCLD